MCSHSERGNVSPPRLVSHILGIPAIILNSSKYIVIYAFTRHHTLSHTIILVHVLAASQFALSRNVVQNSPSHTIIVQVKCFIEEVPDETMVTGKSRTVQLCSA